MVGTIGAEKRVTRGSLTILSKRVSVKCAAVSDSESCLACKDIRRQFSERAFREHPRRHLEFDPVNAIGLDHYFNRIVSAGGHEQVTEEDPDGVHPSRQLKGMCAPRPSMGHAINHDSRSAEIKKERERKETGFYLYAGPGLLCCHRLLAPFF